MDITIRGCIVFPLEERVVLRGYDEYHDIPGDALIRVYSLDEIAAEKTLALLDRSRNEPRDLYDLWFLTTGRHVRLACLRDAIAGKSESRRSPWAGVGNRLEAKEARYERLWEVRLAAQMAELPPFRTVYRAVRRSLRQAGLSRT